jgi:hypothetical protein
MRCLTSFECKTAVFGNFIQFHQFLQANPSLEKLVIESETNYPAYGPRLTNVGHLELSGGFPFRVKRGHFSLPSLCILRMTRLKLAASLLSELVEDEGTSLLVKLTARGCTLGPRVPTSVLLRAPKLDTLNYTGDAINDVAESLTRKPNVALLRDPGFEDPNLCPVLSVLDLSQSADLKTDPVMWIVKERIALAAS